MPLDDWVVIRSRRDRDFDVGVLLRESRQVSLEEGAVDTVSMEWASRVSKQFVLHALTAASPVAVVKIEALALEDEGADAVLLGELARVEHVISAW